MRWSGGAVVQRQSRVRSHGAATQAGVSWTRRHIGCTCQMAVRERSDRGATTRGSPPVARRSLDTGYPRKRWSSPQCSWPADSRQGVHAPRPASCRPPRPWPPGPRARGHRPPPMAAPAVTFEATRRQPKTRPCGPRRPLERRVRRRPAFPELGRAVKKGTSGHGCPAKCRNPQAADVFALCVTYQDAGPFAGAPLDAPPGPD